MSLSARTARRFVQALTDECQRQRKHLKIKGYPRPYYIGYLLRDVHSVHIWGRLGNLNQATVQDGRNLYCDCRVGSYRFDQVTEGGLDDHDAESDTYDHVEMPIGNDVDALKYHAWKLTDGRFREAVKHYLRKRSQQLTYVDPSAQLPSFKRSPPHKDLRFRSAGEVDVEVWKDFVLRSSRLVKRYPQIKNSWVEFRVRDTSRIFVNSEGTQVVDQARVCELSCDLWLLNEKGEGVNQRLSFITPSLKELPSLNEFARQIRETITLLDQLADAPTIKSYAGPVLLAPGPAGILFHEVLGHRLEGSRLLSTREGQTFKRSLGKQILPESITIYDDPSLKSSAGKKVVGHYRYDDEGNAGKRARLVEKGKLVGFLSARSPISKNRHPNNGHARNEYHERPISRMANLVVTTEHGESRQRLRELVMEEIRRQGLPFGIMILDAEGGETATEAYDFQAFMGTVSLALQVWADGRENLVRNINFVGTPLSAMRNILAVGDTPLCENAFCGAESGVIPVSTTCPAVLMSNLELQASDHRKFTPYVLPMPYEKAALKRRRKR